MPMMIRGMGSAQPDRVMTNDDFAKTLDTSDEWIRTRTGIRERRIASNGEHTLTLALAASRLALTDAGLSASDLDMIVVATTPAVAVGTLARIVALLSSTLMMAAWALIPVMAVWKLARLMATGVMTRAAAA